MDLLNRQYQRWIINGLLILAILSLSACMTIATSGASAVYNRHSLQESLNDQVINFSVFQALYLDTKEFENTHIVISTYQGEVVLLGQVPTDWQKTKAVLITKQIDGVKHVYDMMTVASPSSTLTRVSDTWITTKVKAKLIASNDVDGSLVKVITENGSVYLIGTLPTDQAKAAVELASETTGVMKVVKIFTYQFTTKHPRLIS